jgi:hypothetical protein
MACLWWDADAIEWRGNADYQYAECRRRAPVAYILDVSRRVPGDPPHWPMTRGKDWCGEFEPLK